MVSSISSTSNFLVQMTAQSVQQRNDNLFKKVDSNGDGSIDKTEFSDFAKQLSQMTGNTANVDDLFSTYDANGDGKLSKDELAKFMKDNAPAPPNSMGQMNAQSMQQGLNDLFSKIDSNSDGGVDKTEFTAFAKKMNTNTGSSINADNVFSTYDTNNDGKLSKNELAKFMKDNAPAPPTQLSSATSASGTDATSDLSSSLSELLQNPEFSNTLSKLLSILKQYAGNENTASTVNITA